jgi:hypothetical protein
MIATWGTIMQTMQGGVAICVPVTIESARFNFSSHHCCYDVRGRVHRQSHRDMGTAKIFTCQKRVATSTDVPVEHNCTRYQTTTLYLTLH